MKKGVILKNDRNWIKKKRKINIVRQVLRDYGRDLEDIDGIRGEIKEKRSRLNTIKSLNAQTDPVQGGGMSQEDKTIKILDEIQDLEANIKEIEKDIEIVENAINSLDDNAMVGIVYRVWVQRLETVRSIAYRYNMPSSTAWYKSNAALLSIYGKLFKG